MSLRNIFWNALVAFSIVTSAYYAFHGSRFNLWILIAYAVLCWLMCVGHDIIDYLAKKYGDEE